MTSFLRSIENTYTVEEIVEKAKVLNNSYDPFMRDFEIWDILCSLFSEKICAKYKKKKVGHFIVNDILVNYYPCEKVIKYYLAKERLFITDEVTIFEMPINNSRLDVGRINGSSYVFEIKTKYDTLTKLEKQLDDYSKAFEFVFVVVDEKHLDKAADLIPEHCGIKVYDKEYCFQEFRPAERSPFLCHKMQLETLSSQDLLLLLKQTNMKKPPTSKSERLEAAENVCDPEEINELYKFVLKQKFISRWDYVRHKFQEINPIDIQAFYHTSADPYWMYYKNSCIV